MTKIEYIPHPTGSLTITADLTFEEAADRYFRSRSIAGLGRTSGGDLTRRHSRFAPQYIKKRTAHDYQSYIRSLSLFFRGKRLGEITSDLLRQYQHARLSGSEPFIRRRRPHEEPGPCPAGPVLTNHELGFLATLLRRAQLWNAPLSDEYEELQAPPTEIPRALTHDQEAAWLSASQSLQSLWVAHWYSVLGLHTCMGTNELLALKLGDVSLESGVLTVPIEGAKNKYRHRTIPLDEQALWALKNLLLRAHSVGSKEPSHYLFPFRKGNGPFQPWQPMTGSGLKKQWNEVRKMTGLTWFRPYDLRHTAITRMAEDGMPLTMIMSFAGHVSAQMTQHYTHVSIQAQRRALQQAQSVRGGKHFQPQWLPATRMTPAPTLPKSVSNAPTFPPAASSISNFLVSSVNWTGGGSL
jgi:integrase